MNCFYILRLTKLLVLKIRKEIKIGIVFIVALGLAFWGVNFLKAKNIFGKQRTFYAVYPHVKGLVTTNPVEINGLKVGQVSKIAFHPVDTNNCLIVEFVINNSDINIPKNSIAKIESDLLGTKSINILIGDARDYVKAGDTLYSAVATSISEEVNLQLMPIKTKANNLMLSLDTVLTVIKYIFNQETKDNLIKSFENIKTTIANLKHTTYNLDTLMSSEKNRITAILSNIQSISSNLKDNNEKISNILVNFSNISDTLAKADFARIIHNADTTLTNISSIINNVNSGKGSLGKLIYNDSLYNKMNSAADELDQLVEDMKLNPNRYIHFSVFGRNPKKNTYNPPLEEVKEEAKEE